MSWEDRRHVKRERFFGFAFEGGKKRERKENERGASASFPARVVLFVAIMLYY